MSSEEAYLAYSKEKRQLIAKRDRAVEALRALVKMRDPRRCGGFGS